MYKSKEKLVIFDADGTLIDAFQAVETAFARHEMSLGDLRRFQKRRKLFKYLGGLREFPKNLRQQFGKQKRKKLIETLTEVYRGEAQLYPEMARLLQSLIEAPSVRVGIVSRNVTNEPQATLRMLLRRQGVDETRLDFLECLPLRSDKLPQFRALRAKFDINPARAFACGDEYSDYLAAVGAGMHPFIVSYGFDDHDRLRDDYDIPEDVISRAPVQLAARLRHALDIV